MATAVATMCFSSASSAGAMMTIFGRQPRYARSNDLSVRRAVGADEPGAVDCETDRQALKGDVVDDLIVASLQERRIKRAERLHAFRRESGREGHGVLLGDADIKRAIRGNARPKDVEARYRRALQP